MRLLLLTFLLMSLNLQAQKIDTIINKTIYKSYFNKTLRSPVYVSYILYKGGGDCDRSKFRFKNDTKIITSTAGDYGLAKKVNTLGYDMGHLANAEDFAGNCVNDELTFRFYNALPQTPNLNRSIWRTNEDKIRKESQTDKLLIICGGFKFTTKMGNTYVPEFCWKVVKSLSTNKITHVLYYTNTNTASVKEITITELEKILGYKIPLIF